MKLKCNPFLSTSLPLALIALSACQSLKAADTATTAWIGGDVSNPSNWGTAGNWTGAGAVEGGPNSASLSVLFNSAFSNQPTLGAGKITQGIWLATGLGQDVTINASVSAATLTITGTATLNAQTNAGIYMNDSGNHSLTIGPNASITLSNNTGFYNQESSASTLTISGGLNLNTKALTIGLGATSTGNVTINSTISGTTGTITVNNAGTVTFGGDASNTYTGLTTVTSGTLLLAKTTGAFQAIGGALTIGAANNTAATVKYTGASSDMMGTGAVTIKGRGILDFNGATDTIGNVSIVSTGATTSNPTPIINTAGGGNLTIGTLGITPVAGFMSVVNAGTGTLTLGGDVTITAATTGRAQISGNLGFGGAQRTFTVGLGTGANYDLLIDAAMTDGGNGLIKAGAGRLTLSGANSSFTGATTISAGTLQSANAGALANSASVAVNGIGTLAVNYGGVSDYAAADVVTLLGKTTWGATTTALGFDTTNASSGATYANDLTMAAGLTKLGANTLTLTGSNTYSGATTISAGTLQIGNGGTLGTGAVSNSGTLVFNRSDNYTLAAGNLVSGAGSVVLNSGTVSAAVDSQFNTTGALIFGASSGSTSVSNLDLTNGNASFGSLTVQTNNTGNNTITVGSGKTLQIGGAVLMGGLSGTTNLTVSGGGTFAITGSGGGPTNANFKIYVPNQNETATMDLSGLGTFTANLGTGIFEVGSANTTNGPTSSSLILAGTSSITASKVSVAGGQLGQTNSGGGSHMLRLGSGTNTINTGDLIIGQYDKDGKGNPSTYLNFNTTTGVLVLRGQSGGNTRANVHVGENTGSSRGNTSGGIIDLSQSTSTSLSGGNADLMIDALTISARVKTGLSDTSSFTFKSGTMDVNTLVMSNEGSDKSANSTLTLNGGNVTFNTGITVGLASATSTTASSTANFNVAGATVTATPGITMGKSIASGSGLLTSNVTVSAGSLTLGGNIAVSKAGTGTITPTLKLTGGLLDMGGYNIGDATNPITLTINPGSGTNATLQNVGTINGTGGVSMSGLGTLILTGSNSYTGGTTVSNGRLTLSGSGTLGSTSGALAVSGGTLDLGNTHQTVGTLNVTGSAVINLGSGGTLAFADSSAINWTGGTLTITGNYVSGSSLRFGTTSSSLTSTQLALISKPGGGAVTLDSHGYLIDALGGYASWATTHGFVGGPDAVGADGIKNLVKYALGLNDPTASYPSPGTFSGGLLSFTKGSEAVSAGDVNYSIETSTDLAIWNPATDDITHPYINNSTTVSYQLPSGSGKRFAHLVVTLTP